MINDSDVVYRDNLNAEIRVRTTVVYGFPALQFQPGATVDLLTTDLEDFIAALRAKAEEVSNGTVDEF